MTATDRPTVLVVGPPHTAAALERSMRIAGFDRPSRSDFKADVALVLHDPAAPLAARVRGVLEGRARRAVVIAPMASADSFIDAVSAGADGWVLPTIDSVALHRTVVGVHAGESGFSRLDTVALVAAVRRRPTGIPVTPPRPETAPAGAALADLGRAEMRVVTLVADGLNNREIAEHLFLSRHTIESHLKRVYAKLHIRSRVELTRLLLNAGERQRALNSVDTMAFDSAGPAHLPAAGA